jgi:single-stranded-DNA-specific exonuclease
MQMHWNILQPDPACVEMLRRHLNCHPITAAVLANRRVTSLEQAGAFIQSSLDSLPAPDELAGIPEAVERVCTALQRNQKILIIGDYDVDGVTAAAVLFQFLKAAGAEVICHLPHRIEEGYGFHSIHVSQLAVPRGIGLIVTVDCGISSHAAVAAARRFGIDVIVTDHHTIGESLPEAHAILNPKLNGQCPALAHLAGVGVAFYLVIALRAALRDCGWWRSRPEPNLKALCDLVALGTVADIVPLIGANRILTKAGLDQINASPRPGLKALQNVSGLPQQAIGADDIAYRLAPRLNAAGRMAHAGLAFELLCATTQDDAQRMAENLNALNQRRQQIEMKILNDVIARIESRPDLLERKSLILAGTNWHLGVTGIVAAKLATRYYRPVILISTQGEVGKGSGRSIPGVDLHAALSRCATLLTSFGGHRMAAGLTVPTADIEKLRIAFEAAVLDLSPPEPLFPQLTIDCELRFEQITPELVGELERLEPFGADNPAPLFMARDVRVSTAYMVGQRHRRMALCQVNSAGRTIAAIQFNLAPDSPRAAFFERLAFRVQWNRYRGAKELQLVVEA